MPINWQDPEVKDRVLAAVIASFGSAPNCREIARLYGPDATYNAIENFLRRPKKAALQLKEAAREQGRDAPTASPARPRSTTTASADGISVTIPRTPSKNNGVKSGRVAKPKTPSKNSPLKKNGSIKREHLNGDHQLLDDFAQYIPAEEVDGSYDFDDEI